MTQRPRRPASKKAARRVTSTPSAPFENFEWLIANGGSIHVGQVGGIDCVASAADRDICYAILARRKGETVLNLLHRLDKSIAIAAETSETIDEINGP
jgi:hypothetical protein